MNLFAIGDLHLPGGDDKPMDVFGNHWESHFERISQDWRERVAPEDVVLIPGDISWAMQLSHAIPDLREIGTLPGRKILLKGNHDYWWSSLTQVKASLPEGMDVIQHSAIDLKDIVVCGSRGWVIPTQETPLSPEDEKLYRRELMRMEMALQLADKLREGRPVVVMMHYPPLYAAERDTAFTSLFERFRVHTVVYGHLHGAGIRAGFNGEHMNVQYRLVSCDSLGFQLEKIAL